VYRGAGRATVTVEFMLQGMACRPLSPPLRVEWADSKAHEVDNPDVKSLHVGNLPEECTEEKLRAAFEPLAPLDRVALLDQKPGRGGEPGKKRDYAFIHYDRRSVAIRVLEVRFHSVKDFRSRFRPS
jgi:hypothetical protein